MTLPPKYRDLLASDLDPGEIYRRCLAEVARDGAPLDYAATEAIVYAVEVRYAVQVLQQGPPPSWHNFGDPRGDAEKRLWEVLDPLSPRRIAFVGSGPFPVSAFLLQDRYRTSFITCIDNNVVAHLLSQAVIRRLALSIETVLAEAREVDYRSYDVVLVAAMVRGKSALVDRLLEVPHLHVVVRGGPPRSHERLAVFAAGFSDDGCIVPPELQ